MKITNATQLVSKEDLREPLLTVFDGLADDVRTLSAMSHNDATSERMIADRAMVERGARSKPMIFPSGKGTPLNLNNLLNRVILPTLRASGVGNSFAWHRLRRGVATILHDLDVDEHTIKTILRHSDVKTTQGSYIKSLPLQGINAMKKFEVAAEAEAQRLVATTVH